MYRGRLRLRIDWAVAYSWKKIYLFCFFYFVFEGNFQVQASAKAIKRRVFCGTGLGGFYVEGLTHGVAYFQNFTVSHWTSH